MTNKAGDMEKALESWFFPARSAQDDFSENDIREISEVLRRFEKNSWSRIPRIYITLRLIGHLPVIEEFLTTGITDIAFPFNQRTLPETLKSPNVRSAFLEVQTCVLTKALDLEKEDGRHRHLANAEDTPFEKIAELGKGAYGYVDKVRSNISYKEYARKLIPRGKTFRKDKAVLRDFERELGTLKKLSHIHIIELIGSYTDPKYVGIIMSPVADWNLADFLDRGSISPDDRSLLRTFYGCLAVALRYLHENCIRHKDIKPQNVLVKGHQVCFADFGISLDWSELSRCTTVGPSYKTLRYCAPEVAANESRNSASDLWSLGCVFLEIWTTLCGETITNLVRYMVKHGSHSSSYYSNEDGIEAWCQKLTSKRGVERQKPLEWIVAMLKRDTESRCTAQMLCELIMEANNDPEVPLSFIGRCCAEDEDTAESVQSFADDDDPQQTSLPTPQDVFSLENSVSSISLPRFRTPLVQREEPQKHWSSIAVPPMPLSLKAYMTTPSPCLLKAESFTGNRTLESHIAAALPSGSTASLVTLSCEAVPERLPPAEETNSIEVRAPAGNRTSRQPLSVDLGMPHGRTEEESSGKAGTEPLDHRGFMPRDDKNAHREPYNPKLEPYSQKLETKRTSIETHVNSRLHPQPKSSTNLAEIVSKQHQQLSKSAAVLPSIGKQSIPIAHVEPAHAHRPPRTHDIHGISNARTTHVFDRLPPSLLYSSLGQGQRREQEEDPGLLKSQLSRRLTKGSADEDSWIRDARHSAHSPRAQKAIVSSLKNNSLLERPTVNDFILSWYDDKYHNKVMPSFVRPVTNLSKANLSKFIQPSSSRPKHLYGTAAIIDELKFNYKPLNLLLYQTAKVLDELGFYYTASTDGFECIYPLDLARRITETTLGMNFKVASGENLDGTTSKKMRENSETVLNFWETYLPTLNNGKNFSGGIVWFNDQLTLQIYFVKRRKRLFGHWVYIGFNGRIEAPRDIKERLVQVILYCLPGDMFSDTSY